MGAYYHFDGPNCLVKTSVLRGSGSAMWCPDAPSGSIHYHVERWNQLFPSYKVPVPSFCRTQQPGGDNPIWRPPVSGQAPTSSNPPIWGKDTPKNPITGPEPEEPQDGCGPAMSVPEDDRTTSSQFSRTGSASSSGDYGSGVIDQLGQPLVVGMTPLATYAPTSKPNFTQETKIDIRDQYQGKAIHSLHEGTGNGILCFHPPELQDYMLHGSGVNPDSRWPTNISEVTVLLHNCGRADSSTGDSTVTRLAFGNPLSGTVKPKSGVYFEYTASSGILRLSGTDSSGSDQNANSFRLDDMGMDLGQYTTAGLAKIANARAGTVVWDTDDEAIKYYNGSSWVAVGTGDLLSTNNLSDLNNANTALNNLGILRAILLADDNNNSVSTPANTDDLFVTVAAGGWYQFEAWLYIDCDSGFVFDLDGGTATMTSISYDVVFNKTTGTAGGNVITIGVDALATDVTLAGSGTKAGGTVHIKGFVQVNAGGTVRLRHCSADGAGTSAIMLKGSWMRLIRVG